MMSKPYQAADFKKILIQIKGMLYKFSKTYTKNEEDRKDLEQEIIFQLWKSIGSFENRSKPTTWIYRVALNTAMNYKKKSSRRVEYLSSYPIDKNMYDPMDTQNENRDQLYHAMQFLSDPEKKLIELYLENKSYKKIASLTGLTESNVGTKMDRIRKKLKIIIKNKRS